MVHYRIHKRPPPVSILNQINPADAYSSQFLKIHFNNFPPLCLGLPSVFFPRVLPPNPCTPIPCLSHVPHALPISFFLIWSPEWYFVKSTDHKALRNVVFSTPRLPLPSKAQMSSPALHSLKPSTFVRDQASEPHKTRGKFTVLYI